MSQERRSRRGSRQILNTLRFCRRQARHLSESQRAIVGAKLATLRDGQRQVGQLAEVPTQAEAARLLNVSERSIRRAREVINAGAPNVVAAVERGEVSVSAAGPGRSASAAYAGSFRVRGRRR